jgi:hypothetical protein
MTIDDTIDTPSGRPLLRSKNHVPVPPPPAPAAPLPDIKVSDESSRRELPVDDPRARAAARAQELRDHGSLSDAGANDRFYIDPRIIPDGWTYEWRRHSVLGQENRSYAVVLANAGWESVPASRHPELMPKGYTGESILNEGLMLMERPTEIVDEMRKRERFEAKKQMGDKEAQIAGTPPPGTAPRDNKGAPLFNVKRTYEPLIPVAKE